MKKTILISLASAFLLSACSKPTLIVADNFQQGAGATFTWTGNTAVMHVPPMPSWPKGWDDTLTLKERATTAPGVQEMVTFKSKNNADITFINIGDKYVCTTCVNLNLPLQWHRERQK
jgi:hypothetical protein